MSYSFKLITRFNSINPSFARKNVNICADLERNEAGSTTLSRVSNTPYLYILYATLRAVEVREVGTIKTSFPLTLECTNEIGTL